MASAAVDIDDLCEDLGVLVSDGAGGASSEGDADSDAGAGAAAGEEARDRPKWMPLVLLKPPGLDTLLGTIKPPIQIIQALLQVISSFLKALSAILVGLLDPYRALVLAVYELLRDLLEDLVNTGAHFYFDLPGITSLEAAADEFGVRQIRTEFRHGQEDVDRPPPPVDGFMRWATRFTQSFDDPGDNERPILSDGATVTAVFVVGAAPTLAALRQLLHQLGRLFAVQPFVDSWDRYLEKSPDPDLALAAMDPVAPDWHAVRLKDVLPPIKKILVLPGMLRSLLLQVDGIQRLVAGMADVLQKKIAVLDEIIKSIQGILDILDALRALGLHVLPVFTTEGPQGLKRAFLEAENRPAGNYVGGMCFLAGGPGVTDATVLFHLFTSDAAWETTKASWEQTKERAKDEWKKAGVGEATKKFDEAWDEGKKSWEDMKSAIKNADQQLAADLASPFTELAELAETDPSKVVDILSAAGDHVGGEVKKAVSRGKQGVEEGKKKGYKSMAAGLGATDGRPEPVESDSPSPEGKKK